MAENRKIRIDVVSDVMCPWCYVGKKHLDLAIEITSELEVDVHWRPYQLDPTLPPLGKDRQQYLQDKFGNDKASDMHQRLVDAGKKAGLDFRFDLIKRSPNTMNAHRLIKWAGEESNERQNTLLERLFALYFTEGKNIGDSAILAKAAKDVGFKATDIENRLKGHTDIEAVGQQIAEAQQMGVTGVPCFIIDLKHGLAGAYPPDAIADTLRQIAKDNTKGAN